MLFGILLLCLGILLLLCEFLNLSFPLLFGQYWPLIIVLYGLYRFFTSEKKRSSLIITALGLMLLSNTTHIISGNAWRICLAVALILLGINILTTFNRSSKYSYTFNSRKNNFSYTNSGKKMENSNFYEERDFLDDRFLFAHDHHIYHSETFSGGKIEAYFSDVYLDLKNVWSLEKEITLNCDVNFSNIKIDVPADWHVIINGKHYYSKNEVSCEQPPSTTLIINARIVAGNVTIV